MTRDELRAECERFLRTGYLIGPEDNRIDVEAISKGCLTRLDEIALLEEQHGGNTTPIFWELLAERDKLKEEVEQLSKDLIERSS